MMQIIQNTKKLLINNKGFFVPYLLFLVFGLIILLSFKKGEVLLFINANHNQYLDIFYKYVTNLGEGYYFAVVIIILGLFRVKYFVQGLLLFIFTGLSAQILKKLFDEPRPISFFGDSIILNFVDGVDVYSWDSFPSGHSTSAFTIFLFFSFLIKNQLLKFLFFIIALNVAISRIYLVQHFFVDIYFGSLLGTMLTIFLFNYLEHNDKLNSKKWYNYQLVKIKK